MHKVFSLETYQQQHIGRIEEMLDAVLAKRRPQLLWESMRYSALAGGKRIRPLLAIAACEAVGGDSASALPVGAAIELIHTQSLIHDDLPCMDDDDLRRGRPTSHKVYGEAFAILAGDGLLAYAFELLATQLPHEVASRVVAEVAQAAVSMVSGQVVDLEMTGRFVDGETLQYIHDGKTAALLVAAIRGGARVGGADASQLEALTSYAKKIGLAFQIVDDLLDLTGTAEVLGKTPGKDEIAQKATYPQLYGIEKARDEAKYCVSSALGVLEGFGTQAEPLRAIARYVLHREH